MGSSPNENGVIFGGTELKNYFRKDLESKCKKILTVNFYSLE
jgi:hypothetical protein